MPGMDKTGPRGAGPKTGRGFGLCTGANIAKYGACITMGAGLGFACRRAFGRGFGRGFAVNVSAQKTQKELLKEQRVLLQERLELIDKQLEDL